MQLADKTTALTDLEHKLQVAQGKSKELSQHIVKLNGYFENMPTMEEYLALKEHVSVYTFSYSGLCARKEGIMCFWLFFVHQSLYSYRQFWGRKRTVFCRALRYQNYQLISRSMYM